jgi:serpin B
LEHHDALAMARAGAKGTTAAEVDAVLHVADPAALHDAMNGLDRALAERNGSFPNPKGGAELSVQLSSANRAFVQEGLRVEPSFLDTLASRYGVGVGLVDYEHAAENARVEINAFVAKQTRDKIPELIGKDELDAATRLVLVNALYLNADWAIPFSKETTALGTFHAPGKDVQVPLMHSPALHRYAAGDGWRAVNLDYAGGQLTMTILLPDAGRFDEVASHLDTTLLDGTTGDRFPNAILTLPRFHVMKQLSLAAQLSTLGMPTAFSDKADFTGITTQEPLVLDDVIHQADVQVDEQGTVAAAATADTFRTSGAPIGDELLVDRPFLFFVRDKLSGAILFAGQVTDPSA